MIDVAQILRELNNFNGLMEVTSGLNLSVVSRLKQLWENVPKKKIEQLRTLSEIMSPIERLCQRIDASWPRSTARGGRHDGAARFRSKVCICRI
jgi:hypothetical protein